MKIASELIFGYLRYPLCYCLILGDGIYENASKDLLKMRKDSMQSLHLLLPQSGVLFGGLLELVLEGDMRNEHKLWL